MPHVLDLESVKRIPKEHTKFFFTFIFAFIYVVLVSLLIVFSDHPIFYGLDNFMNRHPFFEGVFLVIGAPLYLFFIGCFSLGILGLVSEFIGLIKYNLSVKKNRKKHN